MIVGFLLGAAWGLLACFIWGYYYYKRSCSKAEIMYDKAVKMVQPSLDAAQEHAQENYFLRQELQGMKDVIEALRREREDMGLGTPVRLEE